MTLSRRRYSFLATLSDSDEDLAYYTDTYTQHNVSLRARLSNIQSLATNAQCNDFLLFSKVRKVPVSKRCHFALVRFLQETNFHAKRHVYE